MPINILVPKKEPENARRKAEADAQTLKAYHAREIRDGSRFKSRFSKETIKKVYAPG